MTISGLCYCASCGKPLVGNQRSGSFGGMRVTHWAELPNDPDETNS